MTLFPIIDSSSPLEEDFLASLWLKGNEGTGKPFLVRNLRQCKGGPHRNNDWATDRS